MVSILLLPLLSLLTTSHAWPSASPTTTPPLPAAPAAPPLTPDPTQLSRLSTYFASLTAEPAYTSILSVIATAMPDDVLNSIEQNAGASGEPMATPTAPNTGGDVGGPFAFGNAVTTQSWYTALPGDVRNYLSSVAAEERVLVGGGKKKSGAERGVDKGIVGWLVGVATFFGVVVWL